MYSFKWIFFVIFILNLYGTRAEISDKRKCFDKECKEPLSYAKTLLRYSSPDDRILSFGPNVEVVVYSKEAGSDTSLWGAEIKGKRGYVPKMHVREYKVLRKPQVLVDTEISDDKDAPKVPEDQTAQIEPEKAADFDVVDGTTIYYDNKLDISPSSTEQPVLATESAQNVEDSEEIDMEVDDDEDEDDEDDDEDNPEASEEDLASKNSAETPELSPFSLKVDLNENSTQNSVEPNILENAEQTEKIAEVATEPPQTLENSPLDAVLDAVTENPGFLQEDKNKISENLSKESDDVQKSNIPPIPPLFSLNPAVDNAKIEETKSKVEENDIKSDKVEIIEENSPKLEENKNDSVESTEKLNNNVENTILNNENENTLSTENVTESTENELKPTINEISLAETDKIEEQVKDDTISKTSSPLNGFGLFSNKNSDNTEFNPESTTETPKIDQNENLIQHFEATTESYKEEADKVADLQQTNPNNFENYGNNDFVDSNNISDLNSADNKEVPNEQVINKEVDDKSTILSQEIYGNANTNANYNNGDLDRVTIEETAKSDDSSTFKPEDSSSIASEVPEVPENSAEAKSEEQSRNDLHFEESSTESPSSTESTEETDDSPGFLSGIFSMFSSLTLDSSSDQQEEPLAAESVISAAETTNNIESIIEEPKPIEETKPVEDNLWTMTRDVKDAPSEDSSQCNTSEEEQASTSYIPDFDFDFKFNFNSDIFLYLVTTAVSVILFLFGYLYFDKSQREGLLIARINKLEKDLIIALKENEILQESGGNTSNSPIVEVISNEAEVEQLKYELSQMEKAKQALEQHVQALEKELDTSTEVGIELNRILSEMLKSPDGDENMKANVELMQRQLVEQQMTIAQVNDALNLKETENHELHLELEISNKKVMDLQGELDGLVEKILRIEEERDQQQQILEKELGIYQEKCKQIAVKLEEKQLETATIQTKLSDTERLLQIKENEFKTLKDSMKQIKLNNSDLKSLLDVTKIKAELEQLRSENSNYKERLQEEHEARELYEKRAQSATEMVNEMRLKYEQADKEKVEINTKLDVLNNYFKEREAQLQKELSKYEGLWAAKEGEASSTTERFKYMQEELQNYKAQYESLKQEIISQEVDLKSQISMLEKKAHENWVMARQNERKMQDAQQEAAQLRNRLTMRERAFEDKSQNRITSPLEQNGDLPISPHPIESPASPPLIYGGRDHLTKSPPLPGLPPFLPPPPGAPFMPPPLPLGMPPFMPPPPHHTMLPGDHRPPPLGRMSSPPLNSRYSPDSSVFSPYERNTPSPTYDSEYGTSPPMRGYSPYRDRDDKRSRRDVLRNGRNSKMSSGSDQSIGSIEKVRKPKV